jgi:hypothetical protein
MFKISIIVAFLIASSSIFAQASEFNVITKSTDGLYFMYYDSSAAKSTIVEFENFIVLIEAPIKNEGGGARNLVDHEYGGEKILRTLRDYFPAKPLKYLMHSHWHPHSISSVNPFLRNGVTLVTTNHNYDVIKSFVDTANIAGINDKIIFVSDSLVISDSKNSLCAYRVLKQDYPNVPTDDYLYFYLYPYNILHCACMYNKWEGEPVEGKEILTGREEDLNRFLIAKNLRPEFLIRYNKEKIHQNDMQPIGGLDDVISSGIRSADISAGLMEITQQRLDDSLSRVVLDLIERKIPPSIINTTVYTLIRKKELKKANSFALVQVLLNPSDPNSWDTLGETYFFLGELEMARYFEKHSKKISPDFTGGGMEVWQKDFEDFTKIWQNLSK